jgi:peptide/nickel transport system permease protein
MMSKFTPSVTIALLLLFGVFILVVAVPFLPNYDPYSQNLASGLLPPGGLSLEGRIYLLGSDTLGRDVLSRLALAGRISLFIGFSAVLMSLVIGVFLGLVAGFFRGWTENIIMGVADLQLSIPRVLLLIAVAAILGSSVFKLAILLGLTSWVVYGRVARAMALSLREREFVLSAKTQGATATWNIRKHLLPNVLPQMMIVGSYELGQIIVLEASLSYLGLGVQAPLSSWGLMVSEGQTYLELDPWLSVLPSIALFMLVAGVQILSQSFTAENDMSAEIAKAQ